MLQKRYDLSDEGAANEVIDSRAFLQFCGVDSSNQVPDGDTIGCFRNILVRNHLEERLFNQVVEKLAACGLLLRKGTIVDFLLISAPSSTHNQEKKRDPEAHSVKKGNQWHFGYKEHVGVDADTGLIHTLETTAANVHDSNMTSALIKGTEAVVYGDSGYLGSERKQDTRTINTQGQPICCKINLRPSQMKHLTAEELEAFKSEEHEKSSIRSKIEHVFAVAKRLSKNHRTRYRGFEKVHQQSCMIFALANLFLARNRLLFA